MFVCVHDLGVIERIKGVLIFEVEGCEPAGKRSAHLGLGGCVRNVRHVVGCPAPWRYEHHTAIMVC